MDDPLIIAVKNMAELPDEDKVNIRGKLYAEVHTRVQAFREAFGSRGRIISKVHQADEKRVLTETTISVFLDGHMGGWQVIGNDFAEEYRSSSPVNKTSAVENCLTSSIGRALASCGLSGGNYASFDEVNHAINDKASIEETIEEVPEEKEKATAETENGEAIVEQSAEDLRLILEGSIKIQDSASGLAFWRQEKDNIVSLQTLRGLSQEKFDQVGQCYENHKTKLEEEESANG
jgi:hypothetical protein